MPSDPIARWHRAVEAKDFAAVEDLLADDATFHSPVVHTPQTGKAITGRYLRAAMVVLNVPGFRYVGEWRGERSAVLEFEVTLDGIYVDGVDMIRWNEEGRIVSFKVMMRPLKALNAIMPKMAQQLMG